MVLSPVTFFNGRVDTRRQAQRDSGFFFFPFFHCCGLALVFFILNLLFYFLDTFVLCLVFFGPIFVLQGPKLYAPRSLSVFFTYQATKKID